MKYTLSRIIGVLLLGILLASCDQRPPEEELPPLPRIDNSLFLPIIQEQLRVAQHAVQQDMRSAEAVGRLGMLLHAHDQWQAAELAYRRARLLQPREARWLYYHALVLEELGRNRDAIDVLRFADAEGVADTSMRTLLATLMFESNDAQSARSLLEATLASQPDAARAHFILGRLLVQAGEWDLARRHLEQTIALAGHFSPAYYLLAQVHERSGDREKAARMFSLSEKYRGEPGRDSDPMLAQVTRLNLSDVPLIARARIAASQGQMDIAVDMLNEAIRRNPESVAAHVTLVGLYGVRKRFELALQHFQMAAAIDPTNSKLYYNLGLAYFARGDMAEAEPAFSRAIELNSQDANAHVYLGLIAAGRGHSDEASRYYQAGLDLEPQHRQANWLLGQALVEQGHYSDALPHLDAARGYSDVITPLVLESMAQAQQEIGDFAAARASLEEAIEIAEQLGDRALQDRLRESLQKIDDTTQPEEPPP